MDDNYVLYRRSSSGVGAMRDLYFDSMDVPRFATNGLFILPYSHWWYITSLIEHPALDPVHVLRIYADIQCISVSVPRFFDVFRALELGT